MPRTEHLIPKRGLVVLDPDTLIALPDKGRPVELNSYWHRRIADGDVTVKPHASAKTATKPTKE